MATPSTPPATAPQMAKIQKPEDEKALRNRPRSGPGEPPHLQAAAAQPSVVLRPLVENDGAELLRIHCTAEVASAERAMAPIVTTSAPVVTRLPLFSRAMPLVRHPRSHLRLLAARFVFRRARETAVAVAPMSASMNIAIPAQRRTLEIYVCLVREACKSRA